MKNENKSCQYDGKEYSHGSFSCQTGSQMVCMDGDWQPTGGQCQEGDNTMGGAEIISITVGCFTMRPAMEHQNFGKVWLRNKCDMCKICVLSRSYIRNGNVHEEVIEVKLEPHTETLVEIKRTLNIIDEKAC